MGKGKGRRKNGKVFGSRLNVIKFLVIGILIYIAFDYTKDNTADAGFTTLIMLPFINKVVESYIYWIIVAVIGFILWKAIDRYV